MPRSTVTRRFLTLLILTLTGCPGFVIGDPYTETVLRNLTGDPIEVELVLDPAQHNLDPSTDPEPYAKDWLGQFGQGEQVTTLALDTAKLTGRYLIGPSGFMIMSSGLGTEPWFGFKSLRITQGERSVLFQDATKFPGLFKKTGKGHKYEFAVTAEVLAEGG